MILFIIFFTGHLVTGSLGHLVNWSLSHLVINLDGRAHNNYAKFHYNHHMVQLVTWSLVTWSLITWSLSHLVINLPVRTTTMQNFITIGSVVYERIEDKQTNIPVFFIYIIITSCTLRALLRLQFNLNETRYFVLIVFIEELLNIQYFLFFLLVCTRINRKVFQGLSKLHTVVHVRSMDFSNLIHTLITTVHLPL
jgi:hypothetical protein